MTSTVDSTKDIEADSAPGPPPQPAPLLRWLDLGMRITGFVVAVLLAALTAAWEAALSPLYWNATRVPVSILAAVVLNVALVWFTVTVTGRRVTAAGPALVWVVVMVVASSRTSEGDLVLTEGNWVGIGTMLAGSVAFAVAAYRLIVTGFRPPASAAGSRSRRPAVSAAPAAPPPRSGPDRPA